MYKYIFTILVFSLLLNATMKIKTKEEPNYTLVKALIQSPKYRRSYEYKTNKRLPAKSISQVKAKVGNNVVFNSFWSPSVLPYTVIKFRYKNIIKSDSIEITVIDSEGKAEKFTSTTTTSKKPKTIKGIPVKVEKDNFKYNKEVWKEKTIIGAIQKVYGNTDFSEGKIILDAPESTSGWLPLHIKSDLNLESVVVFRTGEKKAIMAIFQITQYGLFDYTLKLKKLNYNNPKVITITVIGKGKNGKLYRSDKAVKIWPCESDCNGGDG